MVGKDVSGIHPQITQHSSGRNQIIVALSRRKYRTRSEAIAALVTGHLITISVLYLVRSRFAPGSVLLEMTNEKCQMIYDQ